MKLYTMVLLSTMIFSMSIDAVAQNRQEYALDNAWAYEKSEIQKHDRAIYGRLDNGFRYIIQEHGTPSDRISMQLLVQAGSLMENDSERGIAHFLEHLAYNGSKNFPAGELIPFFQKNGMKFGRDLNAYTTTDHTVFQLNIASEQDNIDTALLFMHDVADGILIEPEELDKERGVIISEKNSRASDQYFSAMRIRAKMFEGTEFVYDTIGDEHIIRTVTAETMKAFYDAWYRPEYMVLLVAGTMDVQAMEAQIKATFGDFSARAPKRVVTPYADIDPKGTTVAYDKYPSEAAVVVIRALYPQRWLNDSFQVQEEMLLEAMVAHMLNKRLQNRITQNDAPFLMSRLNTRNMFNMFPAVELVARCEGTKWQDSLRIIQAELRTTLQYGFTQDEVAEAKKSFIRMYDMKLKNSSQESNDTKIESMIGCIMANRVYQSWKQTNIMYKDFVEKATTESLHQTFKKMWSADNRLITVQGGATIKGDAEQAILSLWNEGESKDVMPLVEAAPIAYPYLTMPSEAGTVVKEDSIPLGIHDLSLHEIHFANGLMLRVLPTPFALNTVSVDLAIGAGSNAIADEQYIQAMTALATDKKSGFGNLGLSDAERIKSMYGVSIERSLGQEALTLSSEGQSADIDKLLEAMWTQFNDPAITELDRRLTVRDYFLEDQARTKDLTATTTVASRELFWGTDMRINPITAKMAGQFTVEELQEMLSTLYQRVGGVLTIIGDVDPVVMSALVSKSFGSAACIWAPLQKGQYAPQYSFDAKGEKHVHISTESDLDQASVQIAFLRPLEDIADRESILTRRIVAGLLSEKLYESIREKFGAAYSPSVVYWCSEVTGYGMYLIRIKTQHENLDQVVSESNAAIAELVAQGTTLSDIEGVKKPMFTAWQQNTEKNKLYKTYLGFMARRSMPFLQWFIDYGKTLNGISADTINAEIKAAFADERKATLTGITVQKP